jgi:hypothetical protein
VNGSISYYASLHQPGDAEADLATLEQNELYAAEFHHEASRDGSMLNYDLRILLLKVFDGFRFPRADNGVKASELRGAKHLRFDVLSENEVVMLVKLNGKVIVVSVEVV